MSTDYQTILEQTVSAANSAVEAAEKTKIDRETIESLVLEINEEQAVSIKNSKEAIRQAIIAKGQDCSSSVPFEEYASKISAIITDNPSSSSGIDFYKCASVYGPKEVKAFEVSGCPTAEANGSYIPTEYTTESWDGSQQTVYKNSADYYYYYYGEEWAISTNYSDSPIYRGSGDYWYDSDWMDVEGMSCSETTTTVDTDVPKTWDGYKAVLSNGKYTFESTLTTELTYSENKPEIFNVYSADVSVKADWLYDGDKFSKNLIFHAPLTDRLDYAETGQRMENNGVQLTTVDGVKCARFDGSSYISLPNSLASRLSTGNSPLTIILNFRGDKQTGSILQCRNSGGELVMIRLNDNSRWQFKFLGREFGDYTVGSFYEPNRWWTVVISSNINRKEAGCVIGKTIHAKSNSPLPSDFLINAMYIGTNDGHTDSSAFTGYIKDVRIYDRALTYEEACEYVDRYGFLKTEAVFSAPLSESAATAETGQTLTVSGNVTYGTVDGISCATFDGNSGINFPDAGMPAGTTARTLSCWFKINSIETNSNPALFGYGVRENGKFCGLFIESDGKVVFSGYNEQNHLYSPAGAVSVGKWYHVAAVKNGASEKLYINGVKVAEGTTGKNTELALGTIAYTTDTTAHKFNGSLAACRVYNGALSDSEIAELAEEFTPENGGNDDSGKQTVYTVSGFSTEIANGNYYDTGRTGWENDYPIYSNDKGCYMTYFAEYWRILNAEQFDNDSAEIDMYETATPHEEYHSDPSKAWWPDYLTVASVSGGTDSGKTYVYTVSGAGTEKVNGDYWDSEEVYDGIPVYTNGTCEMFGNQMNFHGITDQPGYRGEAMILYHAPSFTSGWTINEGASPAPTVTEYNQSSGDDSSTDNGYLVTGSGAGDYVNGTYLPDGEKNGLPIYKCNTGAKMECTYTVMGGVQYEERKWEIYDSTGNLAYYQNEVKGNMPDSGGWNRAIGPDPVPTVTKL